MSLRSLTVGIPPIRRCFPTVRPKRLSPPFASSRRFDKARLTFRSSIRTKIVRTSQATKRGNQVCNVYRPTILGYRTSRKFHSARLAEPPSFTCCLEVGAPTANSHQAQQHRLQNSPNLRYQDFQAITAQKTCSSWAVHVDISYFRSRTIRRAISTEKVSTNFLQQTRPKHGTHAELAERRCSHFSSSSRIAEPRHRAA